MKNLNKMLLVPIAILFSMPMNAKVVIENKTDSVINTSYQDRIGVGWYVPKKVAIEPNSSQEFDTNVVSIESIE